MSNSPIPIAIALESGTVLRGHEFSVDGPTVVFVHDIGADLDAWVPLTSRTAKEGFRVVSIELRGHGLSDGHFNRTDLVDDLRTMLGEIRASFGPVALVSYGQVAHASFFLDEAWGAPVQVAVSPRPVNKLDLKVADSKPAMRLILYGANSGDAADYIDTNYSKLKGQKLLASTGSDELGPELLRANPSLFEQMTMFVRRYLIGYHLQFIKDHEDEITERAAERDADAPTDEAATAGSDNE